MAEAPKATREAIEAVDLAENPYKKDFPLLANNPHLTFLDSAATAQRPTVVLDAQRDFYERLNSNPLRGLYKLSVEATEAIDKVRRKVADFIGAPLSQGIVFTRNATESLNLLALSLGRSILGPGDEVCITIMEHHSNILPWQQVCRETGAKLVFMRPNEDCKLTAEEIEAKITRRTKIVSVTQVSNVLGVDVNVQELGCDALAFSAHKMFGPMGIGVLWAKKDLLEKMPPFLTGGEMIDWVTEDSFGCAPVPQKFEAGTQDAAGIAGLGAAVDYMRAVKRENLEARERALVADLARKLGDLPFIRLIGPSNPNDHVAVVSFNVCGIHPHDVASILDSYDVAIRAGHHCAQPLLAWMGIESCCRASVAVYNDEQDIDNLVDGLKKVWEMFNGAE